MVPKSPKEGEASSTRPTSAPKSFIAFTVRNTLAWAQELQWQRALAWELLQAQNVPRDESHEILQAGREVSERTDRSETPEPAPPVQASPAEVLDHLPGGP